MLPCILIGQIELLLQDSFIYCIEFSVKENWNCEVEMECALNVCVAFFSSEKL